MYGGDLANAEVNLYVASHRGGHRDANTKGTRERYCKYLL